MGPGDGWVTQVNTIAVKVAAVPGKAAERGCSCSGRIEKDDRKAHMRHLGASNQLTDLRTCEVLVFLRSRLRWPVDVGRLLDQLALDSKATDVADMTQLCIDRPVADTSFTSLLDVRLTILDCDRSNPSAP